MSLISSRRGFTLIELLVAIAIVGLLASVVLLGLGGARLKGRDARRIADLRTVQNALEFYISRNGVYPNNTGNWIALTTALNNSGAGRIPTDPLNSGVNVYSYYTNSGVQDFYVLKAMLEDISNPVLQNDIDGTFGSLTCDDTVTAAYCVRGGL